MALLPSPRGFAGPDGVEMRGGDISRILSRIASGMTIHLGTQSPAASSCRPGPLGRSVPRLPGRGPYLALLLAGLAVPVRLPVPRWALTPPFHPDPGLRGGLFSVALSLGLPPPGVTRRHCFIGVRTFLGPRARGHPPLRARDHLGAGARAVKITPRGLGASPPALCASPKVFRTNKKSWPRDTAPPTLR